MMSQDTNLPKQKPPTVNEAARLMSRTARSPIRSISRPSRAIRNILKPMGKKFGPGLSQLKQNWLQIVGPRLADICSPQKLTGIKGSQTLTLIAKGSSAMLIQAQSTQLLEKINLITGRGTVKSIRIIQGKIRNTPQASSSPPTSPKINSGFTPKQLTALDEQLKDITNPSLKKALKELGLGVIKNS